jgi:hypothetical protein
VTCTGSATDCGTALQAALNGSAATLYVCPGTYRGGFTIGRTVTVIGAGEGEAPASNTILDGNDALRVLEISSGTVGLQRLRITNGNSGTAGGGGIRNNGATLTVQDCTVANNTGRTAGGINQQSGSLTMTRCTVRDNDAPATGGAASGGGLRTFVATTLTDCLVTGNTTAGAGGGIYVEMLSSGDSLTLAGSTRIERNAANQGGGLYINAGAVTIGADCRVTGNTATSGEGGGIYNVTSTVTLLGPAGTSLIVTGNCHENCVGNVPKCQPGGTCPAVP